MNRLVGPLLMVISAAFFACHSNDAGGGGGSDTDDDDSETECEESATPTGCLCTMPYLEFSDVGVAPLEGPMGQCLVDPPRTSKPFPEVRSSFMQYTFNGSSVFGHVFLLTCHGLVVFDLYMENVGSPNQSGGPFDWRNGWESKTWLVGGSFGSTAAGDDCIPVPDWDGFADYSFYRQFSLGYNGCAQFTIEEVEIGQSPAPMLTKLKGRIENGSFCHMTYKTIDHGSPDDFGLPQEYTIGTIEFDIIHLSPTLPVGDP